MASTTISTAAMTRLTRLTRWGWRKDSAGFNVLGKGQHIVPVETWEHFGFCDEAKDIFDKATIGERFKDHNRLGHGKYTANVKELMVDTISDYSKKYGSKGKLTIDQQKELANMIVNKVKNSENFAIRGFNEAIEKGGRAEVRNFLAKYGDNLHMPSARKLKMIENSRGLIKGIAKIPGSAFKVVKKIPGLKYGVAIAISAMIYNNARADGIDQVGAATLAVAEALNPYPVGPDDVREGMQYISEQYWSTANRIAHPIGDKYVRAIMNQVQAQKPQKARNTNRIDAWFEQVMDRGQQTRNYKPPANLD